MIQRNKDSGKISFLDSQKQSEAKQTDKEKVEKAAKNLDTPISKQKKMSDFDPLRDSRNPSKSVISAGGGIVKDTGGSGVYIGMNGNSILNPNKLDELKQAQDNREKTDAEKLSAQAQRAAEKSAAMDAIVEQLKKTDQRKAATVSSIESSSDTTYKPPKSGISIFDDKQDFTRIPDKTEGEKVAENSRKVKEKDESWREIKGAHSTKKVVDSMFDKLMGKQNE